MRVRTDDEVYRVDAVWLGPPNATFPFRVRYVAWGVGVAAFLLILTVERWLGIGFGFFTTAWALVATILVTKFITARITHERPLGAVAKMALAELLTPRRVTKPTSGAADLSQLRVRDQLPQPKPRGTTPVGPRTAARDGVTYPSDPHGRGARPKDPHGF